MCRGFEHKIERERLNIKAFYIRLSVSNSLKPLPDSLTLYYLPRINGSPLEISESTIRADSPAFVTLFRVISAEGAIFGSRERVRASEGVRFEVFLRDDKVLKGIFRKDEEWVLDCKCVLESDLVGVEVKEAEVCVAVEGEQVAMSEKVEITVVKRKRRPNCFQALEEIPEERELECESDSDSDSDAYCCSCPGGSDGGDSAAEEEDIEGMEMEGVRWAVDVGIWVMCLGVGYLVSKASSKRLRRRRFL
uniref:Uncharacterized protein n=1 Tax=Davidia involucrata TaxID=16924 RepID=A0A5B7BFD2_DAVIN